MLARQRFDYFPRGVNEAWAEVTLHSDKSLAVEQNLMLSYVAPLYFFVSKDNSLLAQRVQQGLDAMLSNGRLDELFYNHPANAYSLRQLAKNKRRTFKLHNPQLPDETPIHIPHYWLSMEQYVQTSD
jgi:tRNA A37 N6-isopentenylltransferase MiaA